MNLKETLKTALPGVRVDAAHYPPGATKQALSTVLTVAQWGVIAATLSGEMAVNAVAGTPPLAEYA